MNEVWVTELEDGEVSEDEAVLQMSAVIGCGSLEVRPAPGGRANLLATEPACVLVDDELLRQLNCTSSVAIATLPNYSYVTTGVRVATVKSAPFAVPGQQLETMLSMLKERGPLHTAQALLRMLGYKPTAIIVASTTAPAGPEDAVGRAMVRIGCHIERFMAPVEPGNLLLLGYKDDVPIISAPACFRSPRLNIVDLVLPPMLSRYRVSGWEISGLGLGGLLA
jgi:molybdenum cofactor cytidylyltransferase